MVFKKGHKPFKKAAPKVEEVKEEIIEEENVGTTVEENEIKEVKKEEKKVAPVVEETPQKVIGEVGGSRIIQPRGKIQFEAQVASIPLFRLPAELRQWLTNKGWGTGVWKKDKEWFDRHNATAEDMKMVEKLKAFLTSMK